MKEKTKTRIVEVAIGIICIFVMWLAYGCSTTKGTLPDGTRFMHQSVLQKTSATVVDVYFESVDPNGVSYTLWIVLNDPNRQVNPGRISISEPRTKINVTAVAE